MNLFLTSSPYLYNHDPATLNPDNEFVERLRAALPRRAKTLFICSDPNDHEMTLNFIHLTKDAFGRAGIPLGKCTALDARNARWAYRLVAESEFIVLMGGHVPTQNEFFQRIGLRSLLRGYTGVIMGISAGSMNCMNPVYAQPELPGESVDPDYRRFIPGLGLSRVQVLPHYQMVKHNILDGKRLYEDITFGDSFGRSFYVLVDGSYVMRRDDTYTLWGEGYLIRNGRMEQICRDGEYITISEE